MPLVCVLRVLLFRAFSQAFFYRNSSQWFCSFYYFVGLCSSQSRFCRAPFILTGSFQGFFFGHLLPSYCCQCFCFVSISQGSFNSECFGVGVGGRGSYFLVPSSYCSFVLVSISQCFSLLSVLFGGSPHVSLWQGDFRHNRKQVVNRLKILQGLSTLLFHRWSEVSSRGGVRGDSPYEKLPALQRCHLSVFSECCFLELLARSSSIGTVLSGFFFFFY